MNNENQNLIRLPVKDLAKKVISDGHLYLSAGGRKFYVMKPGVYVDPGFIKKHAVTNQVFDFEPVINEEIKEKFLKYIAFKAKCAYIQQLNPILVDYDAGLNLLAQLSFL